MLGPGSVVEDRYRLESLIAAGGMGQVWRAQDLVLGRQVAVKVLRAEFTGDPVFLTRFRTEARLSAGIVHPNVASCTTTARPDRPQPAATGWSTW